MEQQRLFLTIGLFFLLYLAYDEWQIEFAPKANPQIRIIDTLSQYLSGDVPVARDSVPSSSIPQSVANTPSLVPSSVPSSVKSSVAKAIKQNQRIIVETDVFHIEIDSRGGDVRVVELIQYPRNNKDDTKAFRLMSDANEKFFIAQSGFTTKQNQLERVVVRAPNHNSVYQVEKTFYKLANGQDSLKINLFWQSSENVLFTKTYELKRGSYQINVSHKIENRSNKVWRGNLYHLLKRKDFADENQSSFIYTFSGGVIYTPEDKYQKVNFSEMADQDFIDEYKNKKYENIWTAMIQHYFVAAWIPPADKKQKFIFSDQGQSIYAIGLQDIDDIEVVAGSNIVLNNILYVGPKIQQTLEKIAPGLELTVDYGILTIIAKPIFWLLTKIHNYVSNWGWSIILLTMLIKLAFYKLSEASYKSMANMRKVQPRLVAMKERFAGDRQKMNQAMMKMYKEEKINPLGGCLPILVQIPVFISLYWVLLESVELRQADWIFWFTDLSAKDPYFVLPLLMGITMFIQQKLNPPPLDPMQAKIMSALPIVFTFFFAFFPSGLVLYWVVNNTLSIMQQWYITRIVIKA